MSKADEVKFRFVIRNQDPNIKDVDIVKLLQQATDDAVKAARTQLKTQAVAELEGGFVGLGETAVILAVWHLAKAAGAAVAVGGLTAAGKTLFEDFLAPRLRKLNLLPSKFEIISDKRESSPSKSSKNKKSGKRQ